LGNLTVSSCPHFQPNDSIAGDGPIVGVRPIGSTPWLTSCSSMKRIITRTDGAAPPRRNRRALEDLVGPTELADLPLELLYPGPLLGRQADPIVGVDRGLIDPFADRLEADAELAGEMGHGPVCDHPRGAASATCRTARSFSSGGSPPQTRVADLCHDSMSSKR
jgi:hypothetical protein